MKDARAAMHLKTIPEGLASGVAAATQLQWRSALSTNEQFSLAGGHPVAQLGHVEGRSLAFGNISFCFPLRDVPRIWTAP